MELIGEFKHAVTHHVKEEEEIVFAKAKKVLSSAQAKDLVSTMDKQKEKENPK